MIKYILSDISSHKMGGKIKGIFHHTFDKLCGEAAFPALLLVIVMYLNVYEIVVSPEYYFLLKGEASLLC